jgi:uncharacterized protein (TIGR00251 family)
VRVTPKASRTEITGFHRDSDGSVSLSVKVTAAPDKGKANKAVIDMLAKTLHLSKSSFELVQGETDRNKVFLISGDLAAIEDFLARLTATASGNSEHGEDH